jgi:cytochrome b561
MEFLTSEWFMWVVIVILIGSFISIIFDSFGTSDLGKYSVWYSIKKIIGFFAAMLFIPIIILIGDTKTTKTEKPKDYKGP